MILECLLDLGVDVALVVVVVVATGVDILVDGDKDVAAGCRFSSPS